MNTAVAVPVLTSSTQLLAANSARAALLVQNPSASAGTIWISTSGGTAVAAPPCIELASGESFSWTGTGPITAIAASGTTTVTVLER